MPFTCQSPTAARSVGTTLHAKAKSKACCGRASFGRGGADRRRPTCFNRESKLPTLDAERSLQMYISSPTQLLAHERKLKENKPHTETLTNRDLRREKPHR